MSELTSSTMNKTDLVFEILTAALIMGVLGDSLLREFPWGLNLLLWVGALSVAVIALARWRRESSARGGGWMILPLLLFSAAFLWRDAPALNLLNLLCLLVALSLILLRAQGGRLLLAGLQDYAVGSVVAGLNAAFGLLRCLFEDIEWKELRGSRDKRVWLAVGRGLLFACPLLLIFGALFVAADQVFKGIVESAFHLDVYKVLTHFFVIVFCAWIVGGYLRGLVLGDELKGATAVAERARLFSLGIIEIGVVLGLLDLLFLSFVVVQFRYFFGGAAWVQASAGLSYAEYARQGFFELATVTALVLPLLLAAHWFLRKESPEGERIFRALAGAQIVLLYVIMVSAVERMRLYQQEYGLTELRLYTTAFMAWLAVVFLWFAATVLAGRRERFAFGAMIAGFALIAALDGLNPDALIARVNVTRAAAGRRFDARYAASMSADAVPELAAALPVLSPPDQCVVAARLVKHWSAPEDADWRAWNLARARARRIVKENKTTLRSMACLEKKD